MDERPAVGEALEHGPGAFDRPPVLIVLVSLAGLCLTRLYSYLLFHSAVEIFTVVVACSMFFLAWNARLRLDNHYVLFIAIASFAAGAIDIAHTLAYRGMGVFTPDNGNLATQLWIAGRYVQSAAFLAAPVFIGRQVRPLAALGVCWAAALALIAVALRGGVLPDCYVDGAGLTRFKVVSEYVVVALLLVATAALWRRRGAFDRAVLAQLIAALAMTAAAELVFTLYVDVYGVANMAGHLLRYLAFCLLCRAIVVTGLVRPYDLLYRDLSLSDERYRAFVANSSEGICRVELQEPVSAAWPEPQQVSALLEGGRVAECNGAFARMHGRPDAFALAGAKLEDLLAPAGESGREMLEAFVQGEYRAADAELELPDSRGERRNLEATIAGGVERGRLVRLWLVERDVTERRRAAAERERLILELLAAMAEVKTLTGLLPICANCKKIRDDQGYWTRVETYLQQRTDVSFTHGICPGCAKEMYPEYYEAGD